MWTPLLLAALQTVSVSVDVSADTMATLRPDSAAMATAYANPATRELVRLAREHRGAIDASVFAYHALVRQRISVGIRALFRDRLLYRREAAATVNWRRDGPSRVEVHGARQAVPVALEGISIPDDLESWALDLMPQPGDDRLVIASDGDAMNAMAWHPLVEGGEAVYRYAIGDSTEIRLPDGRPIRLVELRVTAREPDIRAITGSFWVEMDDHAIVQAAFRPSREFDLDRDLARIDPDEAGEADEVPDILKPIRMDIRYVVMEYGLWEMRWWMPRLIAIEGYLQLGAIEFPVRFETAYEDYEVEGDRYGLPSLPPVIRDLAGDSTDRPRPFSHPTTVVLADSAGLLDSPLLPESLYDPDASLISESELRELASRIGALPAPPWAPERPRVSWPWELRGGLVRYNRIEGLSLGARMDWELGPASLDLTARTATHELEPRAELGVEVPTLRGMWRLAGYHRLNGTDRAGRPFSLGNSLNALLFGRDNGMYFVASGAEILRTPAPGEARYALRLYAEGQADVDRGTDISLPRLFDGAWRFRPNLEADPATQFGLDAMLGVDRWGDPRGFRWGARVDLTAQTGDYTFVRPGLSLQAGIPLPGSYLAAVELAGGTMLGEEDAAGVRAPEQALWRIGGPGSVRGFAGGAFAGPDYGRARLEIATAFPAARVSAFGDAGWTGTFDAFDRDDALLSVGIGASLLNGLLRVDLARTLQPVEQWRVDLYVDGII